MDHTCQYQKLEANQEGNVCTDQCTDQEKMKRKYGCVCPGENFTERQGFS